jgi:hypothetical protein
MAHPDRVKLGGTAVGTLTDTLMVLNHFDGFIAYFHFLNACVPNQKETILAQIIWVSSSHRRFNATSNGTSRWKANQNPNSSTNINMMNIP